MTDQTPRRRSRQPLLPAERPPSAPGSGYELYPGFHLESGQIDLGYESLARRLAGERCVVLDGYGGVFWEEVRARLDAALHNLGVTATWQDVRQTWRPEMEIIALLEPFIGNDDPIFGTRFGGELGDFFREEKLEALAPAAGASLNILYGSGAALAGWEGLLLYFDLPKNEIQYRARARAIAPLGRRAPLDPAAAYRRFYFVDWVVLNAHKAALLPQIDLVVDEQRWQDPAWMAGDDLRAALTRMSHSCVRVRPWFEPGVWGGHWARGHVRQLPADVPNYAWSFEHITPENGLILESDGRLLEVSFDMLMFHASEAVVGEAAEHFGYEFPLRFNFLDTYYGGELAIQCHPGYEYIVEHFGERFPQDESYYILDCTEDSRVYLGFREEVDPVAFRQALEESERRGEPFDVSRYVHVEPTRKHDYFLLPARTVHAAGRNNLILEISATPYIFTFKLYDYLVHDLQGELRPLHIEHGFHNLDFEHQGERIRAELISIPEIIEEGEDWQRIAFPTHPDHFYQVERFDFATTFSAATGVSFHLMNLVDGEAVTVELANGCRRRFHYTETFMLPAAAGRYRLLNQGRQPARVIVASMKPGATPDWQARPQSS